MTETDLITVIYTCGHKSIPHKRHSTGVSDPDPTVCECDACWPEDIKDLSTLSWAKKNPRPYWCSECKEKWREEHGRCVSVIQTHTCGHKWERLMDHLNFLPSENGKYYSGYPGNCIDCYEYPLDDFMRQHLSRGKRYEE